MADYKKNFSVNLKKMRKLRGFTQKDLAEFLGFSEKTVSKWECGQAIADIETIFKIAEVLCTDIETLFKSEEIYYLGIDGGGTKTELALADKDGNIIRTLKADSCNPVDIGIDAAKEILKDSIYRICGDIPFPNISVFAGISGGTTVGDIKEKLEKFFEGFNFMAVKNDSDNKNIIAAGLGKKNGITLILGTGICAFAQKDGVHTRTSGWGYFIDNGGSAYNLGRDALNAYFCAYDGTGEATLITDEVNKMYPGGTQKLVGHIYSGGKKTVASFAPVVFSAMEKGDRIAEDILKRNMEEAAHIVETAARDFKEEKVTVIIAGGLTNQPSVIKYLKSSLKDSERFDIKTLDCAQVKGALTLAMELVKERKDENE